MRLYEFASTPEQNTEGNNAQLVALATFLTTRATEMGAEAKLSLKAFSQVARNLGVPVSFNSIKDIVTQPPLSNVISKVDQDNVYFKTPENDVEALTKGNVQDPEAKVDSMAKSAMKQHSK